MKYKQRLDTKIVNHLFKNEKESYNSLKKIVEEESDDVFNYHITNLINNGIIGRSPQKRIRGKKTFYYLTTNGKKEHGLKLLKNGRGSRNIIFQKIYQEFLLSEFNKLSIFIYNENDFNKFLKDCEISENQLEWGEINYPRDIHRRIIYPNFYEIRTRNEDYIHIVKEFWSSREGHSFSLEDLDFICKPIKISGELIAISKTEHWQINRKGNHIRYATSYSIELPGINYEDLINLLLYKYQKSDKIDVSQIDEAIKIAKKYKLIKVSKFGNYKQIIITDNMLRELLGIIQSIHHFEFNLLFNKWIHFQKPTKEEKTRMERLLGKKEANQMFLFCELIRARERGLRSRCRNIKQYVKDLKRSYGIYRNSKTLDDPYMTEAGKKLYKNMIILDIIDERFLPVLDNEYEIYIDDYIPKKMREIEKEIEAQIKLNDPSRRYIFGSSIDKKKSRLRRFKNYEKNVKDYISYRKQRWMNSELQFRAEIQDTKYSFKDIYYKYEFILKHILQFFLPLFIELDPDPYYTEEEFLELEKIDNKIARTINAINS